jgi:hypothetical protein
MVRNLLGNCALPEMITAEIPSVMLSGIWGEIPAVVVPNV